MSPFKRGWIGCVIATAMVGGALGQAAKNKAEAARDLFLDLDLNKDGAIDRDEVPASGRAGFDRLLKRGDDNHDGKLQAAEYRAILLDLRTFAEQAKKQRSDRFQKLDSNSDGKLSRQEFNGPKARFDAMDRDGDGQLSSEEFQAPNLRNAAGKKKAAPSPDASKKVKKAD